MILKRFTLKNRVVWQFYATLVVNLLVFIEGISISWTSPYIPLLMSEDTPLKSGPMTEDQVSWIAAYSNVGGIVSTIFSGWLLNTLGRKTTLILAAVPFAIGWTFILFATTGTLLAVGRILCGLSGSAVFMAVPVFVAEISDDTHRGQFGSIFSLSCNFGIFAGFVISTFTNYYTIPIVIDALLILFSCLIILVQESPRFHKMKGREQKALQAYKFYNSTEPPAEFVSGSKTKENETESFKLSDLKRADHWKPTLLSLVIVILSICTGQFAIITFTKQIFDETGSQISSEYSSIIIALIQLIGSYVSTLVIERTGRRFLLLFSTTGCGICLFFAGLYFFVKQNGWDTTAYSFTPLVFVSLMIFIFAIGVASVPFVVITEILPEKLRGPIFTLCMLEFTVSVMLGLRVSISNTCALDNEVLFH